MKFKSTRSLNGWFVLDKKDSGEIYNGSLHGNHDLAWMRRKPCHHESGPSNSIQMTTSMSPCRNGSNEPVSLWTSQRGKQDMSTRERSTGKQEEHSFPPRGVVLASISALPCTDLTVNADRPKNTVRFNEWRATSHSFMSNLSLGVELVQYPTTTTTTPASPPLCVEFSFLFFLLVIKNGSVCCTTIVYC